MSTEDGLSFQAALRTRRFWLLCAALFLASGASTGMSTNLVPLLVDRGFAAPQAANMAATFGLAVIAGRIVTGVLIDRFWAPGLVCWFIVPAAIATWFIANQPVGFGTALLLIAIVGLATGAEGDLLSYLVTRYFGMREYGRIFAAVFVVFIAAIAIAAPLFGRSYDLYGSYSGSMTVAAAAWLVCGALLLTLGRYPVWRDAARRCRRSRPRRAVRRTRATQIAAGRSAPADSSPARRHLVTREELRVERAQRLPALGVDRHVGGGLLHDASHDRGARPVDARPGRQRIGFEAVRPGRRRIQAGRVVDLALIRRERQAA